MTRCQRCRREVWPWQVSVMHGAEHYRCWFDGWVNFFAAASRAGLAQYPEQTLYELLLTVPARFMPVVEFALADVRDRRRTTITSEGTTA